MKKILSAFLSFVFVVGVLISAPVTVKANAASQSDLTFALNSGGKNYSVTACKESAKGTITIPSKYNGKPVTKIGNRAFMYCGSLSSIVIPSTVTSIGENAFSQVHSVKTITIPDSVKTIGKYAFSHNNNLTSVKIGKGVTAIPEGAFSNCYSLQSVTIPGNIKTIGRLAFAECSLLESLKVNKGVTTIGDYAFFMATNLKTVILSEGIVTIGQQAFYGNSELKSVVVPGSVKTISERAFGFRNGTEVIPGFKIFAKKGSTAEGYAKTNKITYSDSAKLALATPVAKRINTQNGVKIYWEKVSDAQSYVVYRSVYNTSTKKWSKWSAIKNYESKTEFIDKKVTLGTIYRYAVKAVNGPVVSKYKATDAIRYNVTPAVAFTNTANGIQVVWSKVANAKGYTVYSSAYNTKTKKWSAWSNRGTAKADKNKWVDKTVKSGVTYKYTVRAVYGSFKSKYNTSASGLMYLASPTVKVSIAVSGAKVTWNKIAGAKSYTVYRCSGTSSWSKLGTTTGSVVSFTDKTAVNGKVYNYTVKAVGSKSTSAYVSSAQFKFVSAPLVTASNISDGIKVSWNKNAYADSYKVYKSTYDAQAAKWSSWAVCSTVSSGSDNFYIDEAVEEGRKYRYTVRAVSGKVMSAYIASEAVEFEVVSPSVELTEETVKEVFKPLICNYHSLDELCHALYYQNKTNYIDLLSEEWFEENDPYRYTSSLYKFKDVNSIDELKAKYRSFLSEEIISVYNFESEKFVTIDGAMYYAYMGGVGTTSYDIDSIELIDSEGESFTIAIDVYSSGDIYYGTQEFSVKLADGKYILSGVGSIDTEKHDYDYVNPNYDPDTNYIVY